jgi:hypothetical protein
VSGPVCLPSSPRIARIRYSNFLQVILESRISETSNSSCLSISIGGGGV